MLRRCLLALALALAGTLASVIVSSEIGQAYRINIIEPNTHTLESPAYGVTGFLFFASPLVGAILGIIGAACFPFGKAAWAQAHGADSGTVFLYSRPALHLVLLCRLAPIVVLPLVVLIAAVRADSPLWKVLVPAAAILAVSLAILAPPSRRRQSLQR